MIDLDHNATTRPAAEAVQAMLAALQDAWANPSSTHAGGQRARAMLAKARAQVAGLLGCKPAEIVFTSGATEANHMALLGAVRRGARRLVLSVADHAASLALARRLRTEGIAVDLIPVDRDGRIDLDAARRLLGTDAGLLSVTAASNETGVLTPLDELAGIARSKGVPLHVDATQVLGRSTLRFDACGAALMSVSAHKVHGPKGIGALVVGRGVDWPALIDGPQERGRRGGTENAAGIAGFGAAAAICAATLEADIARITLLRDRLEDGLRAALPGLHVWGERSPRLPNTSLLRIGDLDADPALHALEGVGIAASAGAACGAGRREPSPLLLAMGETPRRALCALRLSLGRDNTADEINTVLADAPPALLTLRERLAA